jgi:hypothetical protein
MARETAVDRDIVSCSARENLILVAYFLATTS